MPSAGQFLKRDSADGVEQDRPDFLSNKKLDEKQWSPKKVPTGFEEGRTDDY